MDRERFVAEGRPRWVRLAELLDRTRLPTGADWSELSSLYRAVAADLSRARTLDLAPDVQGVLDDLAARAHDRLYGVRARGRTDVVRFLTEDVPRQVRADAGWFALAAVLFYGPFVACLIGAYTSPAFAETVVDDGMLRQMEQAYAGGVDDRSAGEALAMTGFYVWNNVGIAFRCFATGVLGGLGSLFFLVSNGVTIGAVFGHVARTGGGTNLLTFVAGHSAWELTAIVISGAAGLRLGWALIATGGRTRAGSARGVAPALWRLVAGAFVMLVVAAAIEGLWSASPVPAWAKGLFGLSQLVVVTTWLVLGGREPR